MTEMKPVPPPVWKRAVTYLPDFVGLAGLVMLAAGVYQLLGVGWTLVTVGAPLFGAYLVRELRALKKRRS